MPSKINNALPVTEVLRECGIDVNALPTYVTCPQCGQSSLYAVALPEGGGWYQCQGSCGFTGDNVTMLARNYNMSESDFLRTRKMQDPSVFNPTNIREYLDEYRGRQRTMEGWREISDRANIFLLGGPTVTELAARMRVDAHVRAEYWNEGLGRLFGIATNETITKYFSNGNGRLLPGAKDRPWMLSPVFRVPGMISGFCAFDHISSPLVIQEDEQGLGLVFLQPPTRKRVEATYALGNPKHAMALHVMAQTAHAEPPPVIAYFPETAESCWQHVKGDKVILWSDEVDQDIFVTARRIGARAYIARSPKLEEHSDPHVQFRGMTYGMVLETMKESAVPWLYALKDYLVHNATGPTIDKIPEKLTLSADEMETLHSYCVGADELGIVDNLYKSGPISLTILTGAGHTIIQRPEGWFRKFNDTRIAQVSGAMPYIQDIVQVTGRPRPFSGYIKIGSADPAKEITFPFTVTEDQFKPSWLRNICAEHGHFITVLDSLNLYDITTRFHKPRIARGLDGVGWEDESHSFVFPHCRIVEGRLVDEERIMAEGHQTGGLHAYALNIPEEEVKQWLKLPPLFWSTYLMGLYNMIAPALGAVPIPVAVLNDGKAPVVRLAANRLYCDVLEDKDKAKILAESTRHRVPIFVAATQRVHTADILRLPAPGNMIVELPDVELAHMAKLLGWHVIAGSLDEMPAHTGFHDLMPSLLCQFQCSSLAPGRPPVETVLELLSGWLQLKYELRDHRVQSLVKNVSAPDMTAAGIGLRLIDLIKLIIKAGELPVRSTGVIGDILPNKNDAVVSGGELCIPIEGFQRATQHAGIHYPITAQATEALGATGTLLRVTEILGRPTGWVLKRSILES